MFNFISINSLNCHVHFAVTHLRGCGVELRSQLCDFFLPTSTWRAKTTSRPNPAKVRGEGQGSERRGLSAGDAPQVYTSVKRVHSVWLHGQSFTKVHCVGPVPPPPHPPHIHTHSQTHTHTHTSSKRHAYTGHRQWGVSGQQSHIHVNLKYFPSLEQERSPRSARSNAFCLQFTQEWTTNSFFFFCVLFIQHFSNFTWCFSVTEDKRRSILRQKQRGDNLDA